MVKVWIKVVLPSVEESIDASTTADDLCEHSFKLEYVSS